MTKLLRTLFFFTIFLVSLSLGFRLSSSNGLAFELPQNAVPPTSTPDPSSTVPTFEEENQRNILAIGVNRVDGAEPQLEGIWLIVYFHDSPEVNLIALFPSIAEDSASYNEKIAGSFSLMPEGAPGEIFWQEMETRTILFHNYFVFDMDALQKITQLVQIDDDYTTNPPNWRETPIAALRRQARLLEQMCSSFQQGNLTDNISSFLDSLDPHTSTNILQWEIEADWQLLIGFRTEMKCLFPNLTIAP
ncbi:MAG: hypothetical protein HN413_13075 [Chloroflexi bacterium]|jgi:hypothetical protein|nr:hypothetical protein [Chloroflexota bacterium]